MNITVEVRGSIRSYLPTDEKIIQMEISKDTNVGDIINKLGIPIERGWNASVRSRLVSDKQVLHDGDHLMIFDVIGGG